MNVTSPRTLAVALFSLAVAVPAKAEIQDYRFQAVQLQVKQGEALLEVRLVDKADRPVPEAVIFAKRMDMGPDGMAAMTAPIEQLPSVAPGVYRFKTNLSMEGRWQLSLAAKVQGEVGTVQAKLVLEALP